MKKLTKRQQQRINHFLREKQERKQKQEIIHNGQVPKFIDRHMPYVRKLARNLDQIVITSSVVSPEIKTGLIDRFLVLAEIEQLPAIICINKVDLLEDISEAQQVAEVYRKIGYHVILTSATDGTGVEELGQLLRNNRSALAGHSGVGKSSLLNAVQPNLQIDVSDVSESTNKGRHTTTKIRVYTLNPFTEVIDLPGIKLIDFVDIHRDEARLYFREFDDLSERCRFRDCMHITEHDCAVKAALEEGTVHRSRYESYLQFVESLE